MNKEPKLDYHLLGNLDWKFYFHSTGYTANATHWNLDIKLEVTDHLTLDFWVILKVNNVTCLDEECTREELENKDCHEIIIFAESLPRFQRVFYLNELSEENHVNWDDDKREWVR